jgi:DUF4097 and DUF4098 domain-containing protein YvlB
MTTAMATETHDLPLTGTPSLTLRGHAGNIVLHPGSADHLLVAATKRGHGFLIALSESDLDKVQIGVQQSGNHISLAVEMDPWTFLKKVAVDLDITVPASMTWLDLTLRAGNLKVDGVSATIKAQVTAGNLEVLSGATLEDGSRLAVTAGNVTVSGALAPGASVKVEVQSGNLRVNLPQKTATYLDAHTHAGNIEISGLPVRSTRHFGGTSATGALAAGATGTLKLGTRAGNIVVSSADE